MRVVRLVTSIWMKLIFSGIFIPMCASVFEVEPFIKSIESEYKVGCNDRGLSEWSYTGRSSQYSREKWDNAELEFDNMKKEKRMIIGNSKIMEFCSHAQYASTLYKCILVRNPGDAVLDEKDRIKILEVTGGVKKLNYFAKVHYNYLGKEERLSREEVEYFLSQDEKFTDKRNLWFSWYSAFQPLASNFSSNLKLVEIAAKVNGEENVADYWEMLTIYPHGYEEAEYMWEQIMSLHQKIVKFVYSGLSKKYDNEWNALDGNTIYKKTIPVYLLGSLQSYDWTGITDGVIPEEFGIEVLRWQLQNKTLTGESLYEAAAEMGKQILNREPQMSFWRNSQFDQFCPSTFFSFCWDGLTSVSTCNETSIANFLAAHRDIARVLTKEMTVDGTPVLNDVNRYSGLEEAVAELFAILSVSPARLSSLGFDEDSELLFQSNVTSLMITALDVLPRLAYYLFVDFWRISILEENVTEVKDFLEYWWKDSALYTGTGSEAPYVPTYLDDNYILKNKPYLPKFLGTILAFQLYEQFTNSTELLYDEIDFTPMRTLLTDMFRESGEAGWMTILEEHMGIENISADALLAYFAPLELYIDAYEDALENAEAGLFTTEVLIYTASAVLIACAFVIFCIIAIYIWRKKNSDTSTANAV